MQILSANLNKDCVTEALIFSLYSYSVEDYRSTQKQFINKLEEKETMS